MKKGNPHVAPSYPRVSVDTNENLGELSTPDLFAHDAVDY